MDSTSAMISVIIWIVCGIGCYYIAQRRNTAPVPWLIIGILLGPLGLLFALVTAKEGKFL